MYWNWVPELELPPPKDGKDKPLSFCMGGDRAGALQDTQAADRQTGTALGRRAETSECPDQQIAGTGDIYSKPSKRLRTSQLASERFSLTRISGCPPHNSSPRLEKLAPGVTLISHFDTLIQRNIKQPSPLSAGLFL